MEYSVTAESLRKQFGDFTAVDNVSFRVKYGEIFGFLGPNGAGKTTTIKMLCGLLRPSFGKGAVAGFDIERDQKKVKTSIGYMSQKFSLYEDLSVVENLSFFGGVYGIKGETFAAKIEEISNLLRLKDILDRPTKELPLGLKQRLALGCAILHSPKILFLDEPTSGVAPDARRSFWNLIYKMASKGVTVFVTTHYMDEAEHCDRLALINRGEIIASGTPSEIRKAEDGKVLLEIKCEPLIEGLKILEGSAAFAEPAPFGNSIHANCSSGKRGIEEIRKLFSKKKIKIHSINVIKPSLEDAFVRMIREHHDSV